MDQLLKTWTVERFTCKLWRESETVLRGCVFDGAEAIACAEVLSRDGVERAERAVEALVPVMGQRGQWLITDDTPVIDLVLVLRRPKTPHGEPRLTNAVALGDDIEIRPIAPEQAALILDACDPPGRHRGDFRVDLRDPLYVIARHNAPREPLYGWDPDERLQLCIALSRLVRPTSISFGYAVRLIGDLRGRYELVPGPVRGFGARAWTAVPERDWLSLEDMAELGRLAEAFTADPFPRKSRLARALWYIEYAARTELVDLRLPLVATAAETVCSTSPAKATRHFTRRLPMLAQQLDLPPITKREASRMWGLRSAIVHGEKHGGLEPADVELYRRMEEVVRAVLRRALTDRASRAIFDTHENIDAALPVPDPPSKAVRCPNCGTRVPVAR